jgi:hypothetical protein
MEKDKKVNEKFELKVKDNNGKKSISEWDNRNIKIKWERKRSDGGYRIKG